MATVDEFATHVKDTQAACVHMNFNAYVSVNRIHKSEDRPEEIVAYTADVKVTCRECGQEFAFFGLPNGYSFYQPTVSLDGKELHVPLVIPGTEPPKGLAGFPAAGKVYRYGMSVQFTWVEKSGRNSEGERVFGYFMVDGSGYCMARIGCPVVESDLLFGCCLYFGPNGTSTFEADRAYIELEAAQRYCEKMAIEHLNRPSAKPPEAV